MIMVSREKARKEWSIPGDGQAVAAVGRRRRREPRTAGEAMIASPPADPDISASQRHLPLADPLEYTSTAVTRRARLGLLSVSLFLLAIPLTVGKPGLPPTLKSDEPAYYLMAESIAHDGDLEVDTGDLERLFDEFPYRPVPNLILMTDDGWKTVLFGKPYLYSLFAAPFARLAGADGMLLFNMLLLVAMIWMGAAYLARWNPDGTAAIFAGGFFVASAGFSYVFWLHPEVFNMAAVAACLYLGLGPALDGARRAEGVAAGPAQGRW